MGSYDTATARALDFMNDPDDSEFDGAPTKFAVLPEHREGPTDQVDLAALAALEALEAAASAPDPYPPPPEPYRAPDAYYDAVVVSQPRGWGPAGADEIKTAFYERQEPVAPQAPPEEHRTAFFERPEAAPPPENVKTAFFERHDPVPDHHNPWNDVEIQTALAVKAPAAAPIVAPAAPREITGTYITPKSSPRRGRAVILAGVCVAAGIGVGTIVGLAANLGDSPAPIPPSATSSVVTPEPVEVPVPAPEAIVAPVPPEPEPVVEAAPPPIVEPVVIETPAPADRIVEAEDALRDGNVEDATEAIDRAREAGAEAAALARLDAELAVLRGDGELAVTRLRGLAEVHREPVLWVALGRVLVQAERDPDATLAFQAAHAVDARNVAAHLGLVGIYARSAQIANAQRHLREARDAIGADARLDPQLEGRLRSAEASILLERGELGPAQREAEAARALDGRSAEAALLLARIDRLRSRPAEIHLREALAGRAPAPLALALLAASATGEEACELAARYLDRAPQGFDARDMQRIVTRCAR